MTHLRTVASLLATSTLTLTSPLLATASAHAAPAAPTAKTDDGAVTLAAGWLKKQLTDGLVTGAYGPDYGLSIDVGTALDQAGDKAGVATVNQALQARIGDYVTGESWGDAGSSFAGPTAKAATFARVAGANATSYGGLNLISRLEERVSTTAPIVGRIEDRSKDGDYANVVGQSFAARALTEAKSAKADSATAFLLAQQCTSGFFRQDFTTDKSAAAQGCVEGAAGSEPNLDTTALAVVNLVESDAHGPGVKAALDRARTWLAAQQKRSGAFGGSEGANTNSTAVAGWALGLLKDRDAATKAAVWVRKQQPVDKNRCRSALTKDTGAVAYDGKAVKAARTSGIKGAVTRDQWRRATAQAVAVLQWAPAATADLAVTSKRAEAEAGDKVRFKVTGLAPGERACLSVKGDYKRLVGKSARPTVTTKLVMPTGNRSRIVKVKTADQGAKTRISVHN